MKRRGWNVVSAPIALVAIGRAQLTGTPSFTSAAARFRIVELHLAHRRARVRPEPRAKRVVRLQREEAAVQAIGRGGREPVVDHSDYRLASDGGAPAPRRPAARTASGHSTTALP